MSHISTIDLPQDKKTRANISTRKFILKPGQSSFSELDRIPKATQQYGYHKVPNIHRTRRVTINP